LPGTGLAVCAPQDCSFTVNRTENPRQSRRGLPTIPLEAARNRLTSLRILHVGDSSFALQ
jgi:hypothetical protein